MCCGSDDALLSYGHLKYFKMELIVLENVVWK